LTFDKPETLSHNGVRPHINNPTHGKVRRAQNGRFCVCSRS
jgi:hypothetical protein